MKSVYIESVDNPRVKKWVSLRIDAKERRISHAFLVVGKKMVGEAFKTGAVEEVISLEKGEYGVPSVVVSLQVMKKITGQPHPEGIAAVVKYKEEVFKEKNKHFIVLDKISDPGNMGTLLRTAWGLGWGVRIVEGCVDPYNERVISASRGAIFHVSTQIFSPQALLAEIKELKGRALCASPRGAEDLCSLKIDSPVFLFLGNESHGVSFGGVSMEGVSIPLETGVESLNVAAAGAILMYALKGI